MAGGPRLARADRAWRERHDRPAFLGEALPLTPGVELLGGHPELGQGPFGGEGGPSGQRQCAHLVDHARQLALARPQVVEEPEPRLAEESGTQRDAGQEGRQRRLPFARHHERLAVMARAQLAGQLPLQGDPESPPRQVGDNRVPHARHVVGKRRT